MALSDISFKLYNEAGLTSLFTGVLQITHQTDLSDNPQDFQLFLGSNTASRQIEATSNPGVDNISLTPTNNRDVWTATTVYALGDGVEPTTPNTFRYVVTIAGTSSGSEPTFPTGAIGDTVVDGTVTWTMTSRVHEITEVKLATTSGGLSGATPGASLSLGTSLASGVGNAQEINIRVTNAVVTVGNTVGLNGLDVDVNSLTETVT